MELKDLNNSATLLFKIYVRVIAAKWLKIFSLKIFFTQIHVSLKSQRLKLHFFRQNRGHFSDFKRISATSFPISMDQSIFTIKIQSVL